MKFDDIPINDTHHSFLGHIPSPSLIIAYLFYMSILFHQLVTWFRNISFLLPKQFSDALGRMNEKWKSVQSLWGVDSTREMEPFPSPSLGICVTILLCPNFPSPRLTLSISPVGFPARGTEVVGFERPTLPNSLIIYCGKTGIGCTISSSWTSTTSDPKFITCPRILCSHLSLMGYKLYLTIQTFLRCC